MAAASILSTGSTAASSSDVVVAAGTPLTVALKASVAGAEVVIELKDDASAYNIEHRLTHLSPATTIVGPGTYRFTRIAGATCGVFSG